MLCQSYKQQLEESSAIPVSVKAILWAENVIIIKKETEWCWTGYLLSKILEFYEHKKQNENWEEKQRSL